MIETFVLERKALESFAGVSLPVLRQEVFPRRVPGRIALPAWFASRYVALDAWRREPEFFEPASRWVRHPVWELRTVAGALDGIPRLQDALDLQYTLEYLQPELQPGECVPLFSVVEKDWIWFRLEPKLVGPLEGMILRLSLLGEPDYPLPISYQIYAGYPDSEHDFDRRLFTLSGYLNEPDVLSFDLHLDAAFDPEDRPLLELAAAILAAMRLSYTTPAPAEDRDFLRLVDTQTSSTLQSLNDAIRW